MNTSQLKTFAQKARTIVRNGVSRQLKYWGFNEDGTIDCRPEKVEGGIVHREEIIDDPSVIKRWEALSIEVKHQGFDQIVEEAAYTWFNRIMAIRILSKNAYDIPQLEYESEESQTPLILQRARRGQFAFLNKEEQARLSLVLSDYTKDTQAFAILLTGYCHSHSLLNNVFGRLDDFTELLLPANILGETGLIHLLNTTTAITDDDYKQVELIGWLYQFYISEKKAQVFAQFKKNKKAEAKDIPAATQIFTPNWIVKYMVENTVGRIWLDKHPESAIKTNMKYLVEAAPEDSENKQKETPLIQEVSELKLLDPAVGSGHILVEGFDLLYEMYLEEYYMPEEAVESILRNNLFGLDISRRATQLAQFALLMKAASKFPDILKKNILPNIYPMPAPNEFSRQEILDFLGDEGQQYEEKLSDTLQLMQQAQNLGSVMKLDFSLEERNYVATQLEKLKSISIRDNVEEALLQKIAPFIEVIIILTNQYEAVAANPPYMGQKNMNAELKQYVNQYYSLSRSDLFAVFMEVCISLNIPKGLMGMINQHSWMFLSSYEKLRKEILEKYGIVNMIHLGSRTFEELSGEVVQSTAFVINNGNDLKKGTYFRLVGYKNNTEKEAYFLKRKNQYSNIYQVNYFKIPGGPIAYWAGRNILNSFELKCSIHDIAPPRIGMMTTDNKRFLRSWFEVPYNKIRFNFESLSQAIKSSIKWFPYNKGGGYRKWYGNKELVVNWQYGGKEIIENGMRSFRGKNFYFMQGISWSDVSSSDFACRYTEGGHIFDIKGSSSFPQKKDLYKVLALQNSIVSSAILNILNPTLSYQSGDIRRIPYLTHVINSKETLVDEKVLENINISTLDWNSQETSWDFKQNPILPKNGELVISTVENDSSLENQYENWEVEVTRSFYQVHTNEEELNRIFIDIYGLNEELDPVVALKDITILQDEIDVKKLAATEKELQKKRQWELIDGKWQLFEDNEFEFPTLPIKKDVVIKQMVSYAIGCMMGRYRLDKPGLHIAHPNPTAEEICTYNYFGNSFEIDDDAIIPLMGSNCTFSDDGINRFTHFLEIVWGAKTLTQNKNFIADCLNKDIEKYLLKDFWKDHCRTYKKKPIYWLFASEKGAFQALVYMHRMNRFTVEKIRSKYLLKHLQHLQQDKNLLEVNSAGLSREELKRLDNLRDQYEECERYELLLKDCADRQIEFDLDDGVKVNYQLFEEVLAPIK